MNGLDAIFVTKPARRGKRSSRRWSFLIYQTLYGPRVFLKAIYRQIIVLAAMFLSGAALFSYYDGLPPVQSLLASVSTITTIGLYVPNGGDFFTMDVTEAGLLIGLILISVSAGASIVQSTASTMTSGDLAKGEVEKRLMKRLQKHVIVFGYNHMGRYVTEKLNELGLDHVVITKDPVIYNELLKKNVLAVLEYATQPITALTAAGIDKASMVVVAHESDSENMLTILSARRMRPDVRIVTVVHDESLGETARSAGADAVIPASATVGHLLALSAVTKDLVGVVFSQKIGTKEIAEFSIFKSSKLIGKGLQEISKFATVIGVVRNNEVMPGIFDPAFVLRENDTLLVLGDPSKLQTLEGKAKAL